MTAAAALDYPRDRLEIQILDDSSDATRELAAQIAQDLQQQGVDVVHLTRAERTGFEGGALAAGLAAAKGEFLAILDADFSPPPGFLRRVLPEFTDPGVGCVQTRWGHFNRDYSLLTQVQALGPPLLYAVAQFADGGQPLQHLRALPLLVLLGTGIALSNTCAVLRAALRVRQGFQRTPKFAVRERGDPWAISAYALGGDTLVWGEAGLALWALGMLAMPGRSAGSLLWVLLCAGGFGSVASASLLQACERHRWLLNSRRSRWAKQPQSALRRFDRWTRS